MQTKQQNISSLQDIEKTINGEIESLTKDLESVKSLISRFTANGHVLINEQESKSPRLAKTKVTKSKLVKSGKSDPGKEKLSKFMLDYMRMNHDKDFDIATLSGAVIEAINSGKVTAPAGKVKDEVGKRLYQFRNRGDVCKTLEGTYMYSEKNKATN